MTVPSRHLLPTTNPTTTAIRRPNKTLKLGGTIILTFCLLTLLNDLVSTSGTNRRSLLSTLYLGATHSTLLPWSHHQIDDVKTDPKNSNSTAMFWHIPKSGGTTAKRLYMCMGQTLSIRIGIDPRYGHDQSDEIVVFRPGDVNWNTVNVDTTIRPGIMRAAKMGLVQSHTTDLIFTMEPQVAGEHLYDEFNRGRILALFRHPIDRVVSKFYYLQTATWEKTYRPEWAELTILEWAQKPSEDENFMVRKLVGKSFGDPVDLHDLIVAKELVRQRVVVGLMSEMEESFKRFNIVLGVDENEERNKKCMDEFFGEKEEVVRKDDENEGHATGQGETVVKKNSNAHPKVVEGTPEWEILAEKNSLDLLLYSYIELLFKEQKDVIYSYASDVRDIYGYNTKNDEEQCCYSS
mmetsp:Transcript_2022/g.4221  ORF Transcript_2022/g.4221 Transcript_2022/m.4221 type:complete len:406 (+) Transcript_2022:25-1242(+)